MDTKNTRMELGAPEFDWYDFIFDKIPPVFAVLTVFTVLYFGLVIYWQENLMSANSK